MVHIYEDKETTEIIKELRERDSGLNLAEMFKDLLREKYHLMTSGSKLSYLHNKLEKARFEKAQAEEYIEKLTQQLKEIKEQNDQEQMEKEKQEEEDKELRKERVEIQIGNIDYFFGVKGDEARDLAEDYVKNYFKKLTIVEYMEKKGYKCLEENKEEKPPEKKVMNIEQKKEKDRPLGSKQNINYDKLMDLTKEKET